MKIDRITDSKMKISLTDEEVDRLFGSYEQIDYADPCAKAKLNRLINRVLPKSNFPLDSRQLLIEIRPQPDGCAIYLIKIRPAFRRLKRVTESFREHLFEFPDCQSMIDSVNRFYHTEKLRNAASALYTLNGKYYLSLTANDKFFKPQSGGNKEIPAEKIPTTLSVCTEYGKILCPEKAVLLIGAAFDNITPPTL